MNTWYRINTAQILTSGSNENNVGTITCRHTTSTSNIFFVMAANTGRTLVAAWTVPYQTTLYIGALEWAMTRANGSPGSCVIDLQSREFGSNTWQVRRRYGMSNGIPVADDLQIPININGQADIRVRVVSVSDSNTVVTAVIAGVYIDD